MNKTNVILSGIGYSFGVAAAASLAVLLIGRFLLGHWVQWGELEGRWVGIAATVAGVTGAIGGSWMASHPRRAVK